MSNIDLKQIFQLFRDKQFHYGTSMTNSRNGDLMLDFTTSEDSEDNMVEMRLGNANHDIDYMTSEGTISHKKLSDSELINFIKNEIN